MTVKYYGIINCYFLLYFIVIFLSMMKNGETYTKNTIELDWTTMSNADKSLFVEKNQSWEVINCTYGSEKSSLSELERNKDEEHKTKLKTNWSGHFGAENEDEASEKIPKSNSRNKKPTLIEALTKSHRHSMKIFWALFSQLSAMSDFSDDETPENIRSCSPIGTIYDSHVTLCPFCRVKTKLPVGHIPPYIDEVICEQTDGACFRKQGKCFQRFMKITALRKIPASNCLLADQNGRQFWTQNWEIYDQKVRVSCECLFDKRSKFLKYVLGFK